LGAGSKNAFILSRDAEHRESKDAVHQSKT